MNNSHKYGGLNSQYINYYNPIVKTVENSTGFEMYNGKSIYIYVQQ